MLQTIVSLDERSPVLTNSEVAKVLSERGAASLDQFSRATVSEKAALAYLSTVCDTPALEAAAVAAFRQQIQRFGLASAEVVQLINVRPRSAVSVHLIVEDIEERFGERTDEVVDEIIAVVDECFPAAAS